MGRFFNYRLSGHGGNQQGFTLVEVLVVTSIIAALAAVWGPRVIRFACDGAEAAADADWDAMQAIIDNMMGDQKMDSVDPSTGITRVSDTLDWDPTPATQTIAAYTRDAESEYCYTWLESGRLTGQYELNEDLTCSTVQTGCDVNGTGSIVGGGVELVNGHFPPMGPHNTTRVFDPEGVCDGVSGLAGTLTIASTHVHAVDDDTLSDLFFEVAIMTGAGNLLCNGDGGPGGVGSTYTVTVPAGEDYADGLLQSGESFDVEFVVGLPVHEPFDFFVNLFGVVE